MESERANRVKWWDHAGDVSDHKGLPRLEIQYVRRANSGIRTRKYQKLQFTRGYLLVAAFLFWLFIQHLI